MTPDTATPDRRPPTVADLQQWARENARLASAVLAARVFAEAEAERVAAYAAPILARYAFTIDPQWARTGRAAEPITTTRDLYLVDHRREAELPAFYAELDAAHRARGFKGPVGHCPALTAETLHRQAEAALLDSGGALFGFNASCAYGDLRAKMIHTLIGACIQTGRVRNLFADAKKGGAR